MTWSSFGQDGDSYGIYARRYNAMGESGDNFVLGTSGADSLNVGLGYVAGAGGGYAVRDVCTSSAIQKPRLSKMPTKASTLSVRQYLGV